MRKIEKETLEIINNYKSEEYLHYKKLITIRENELKENLEEQLRKFINKDKIKSDIEIFKRRFNFDVEVDFNLCIRSYYTDYQALYENDKVIQDYKECMNRIEKERNTMKLILQNSEIKSEDYKIVIRKLKKGE
jgi:transcriptional regulator